MLYTEISGDGGVELVIACEIAVSVDLELVIRYFLALSSMFWN